MRVKTSVTLPSALLKEIDRLDGNRSAFLERAAVAYIGKRVKSDLDAQDAAILDRVAGELNEQSDVLEFQGMPKGLTK
jgi:metal-responsive CopG/Arc/MetJ family transcriptional regulator